MPKDLAYLEGIDRDNYIHDMRLCQIFAQKNRQAIAKTILDGMGLDMLYSFETIHNYISDDNIVRKGAISAKKGEKILIPINMRDGCIIGVGLGNKEWNESAPHGAGRIMSRAKARKTLNLDEYKETMKDIYTTSVGETTIDEAPMAYKPIEEIVENIKDTIQIVKIIKPIYNYKAH